ncbi:MAG: ABC transporter ATP-binding protein, partial [Treponema sp.]|nr:ABC transporter ATP-binding protein [Treponema sp.]
INCIPRPSGAGQDTAAESHEEGGRLSRKPLPVIPGSPPALYEPPQGCPFAPRCPRADAACAVIPPVTDLGGNRSVCCHHWGDPPGEA